MSSDLTGGPIASGLFDRDARARIFAGLEDADALLLAVSGGPDSMALMHLATQWAHDLDAAPKLHVATVDHGLRPEACAEAMFVAEAAHSLGLEHRTLTWHGPKPVTRVQERARAARYGLLAAYSRSVGAAHILTAHHADDQAETVLLRLTRGSGLTGLAGMRRETGLQDDLTLVRPLLDFSKADLIAVCRAESQRFVEDTSNANTAYARARLRKQAEALTRLGLGRDDLVRFARRMARADAALEAATDRLEASVAAARAETGYHADLARIDIEPELVVRLLARAIAHASPSLAMPRLERLERLADEVLGALKEPKALRRTLGGARVLLSREGRLDVLPEGPRGRPVKAKSPR